MSDLLDLSRLSRPELDREIERLSRLLLAPPACPDCDGAGYVGFADGFDRCPLCKGKP